MALLFLPQFLSPYASFLVSLVALTMLTRPALCQVPEPSHLALWLTIPETWYPGSSLRDTDISPQIRSLHMHPYPAPPAQGTSGPTPRYPAVYSALGKVAPGISDMACHLWIQTHLRNHFYPDMTAECWCSFYPRAHGCPP